MEEKRKKEFDEFNEKYGNIFRELNAKEKELRQKIEEANDTNDKEKRKDYFKKLDELHERKNEISFNFIKDINSGNLSSEFLGIIYVDEGKDFLYDEVLIDLDENYDLGVSLDFDNCFSIPMYLINKVESGSKEIYDFVSNRITETYYSDYDEENYEEYSIYDYQLYGPFSLNDYSDKIFSRLLESYRRYCEDKFYIFDENDDMAVTVKNKFNEFKEKLEKNISMDMEKYNLTYEQADYLQNIFGEYRYYEGSLSVKDVFAELIKKYDISWLEEVEELICSISLRDFDQEKETWEEYVYSKTSHEEKMKLAGNINLTDDMFSEIFENANNSDLITISKNHNLKTSQVLAIKNKALSLDSEKDEKSIFSNLLSNYNLEEDAIREMFNGSQKERKIILSYCRNIPEDLIAEVISEQEMYEETKPSGSRSDISKVVEMETILKNNQTLSQELIERFLKYANIVGKEVGFEDYFQKYIVSQKNVSAETLKEIAKDLSGTGAVYAYLGREGEKSEEIIEILANYEWLPIREVIAEEVSKGTISVNERTFRKLALDKEIGTSIREKLLEMPEFKEELPIIDKNSRLNVEYRDVTFGGYGPGSFDNKGGERRFYINEENVLKERGYTSSYGTTAEEMKWARNAYTSFDSCTEFEQFETYCNEHKEAVLVMIANHEQYNSMSVFEKRVSAIEKALEQSENLHEMSEIEEAVSDRTVDDVNKIYSNIAGIKIAKKDESKYPNLDD